MYDSLSQSYHRILGVLNAVEAVECDKGLELTVQGGGDIQAVLHREKEEVTLH
jgi:hypothetical protein